MQTLETLRRRIESTQSLHSVVRTMKVLSMTSIRQCEDAVDALSDYYRTIRLGLQIALRHRPRDVPGLRPSRPSRVGALVFGSTWGMCGRFNEQLARAVADHLAAQDADQAALMTFGEYIEGPLEMVGHAPDEQYAGPESAEGITRRVQEVLVHLEAWRNTQAIDRIVLFYNTLTSSTRYDVTTHQLLPLDQAWLEQIEQEEWPTRMVPTFRTDWDALFAALVRQYLFVSLYRAFAESLASEHSSRLAAMQRAERNVEERLDALHARFHQQRQDAITEEVLDIAAGFEALHAEGAP
ncbi:MAG: F0F1 ATP synthase subunit gamma [Bacteroidetes bacterium]|jgi:F-type H+-transporting ATPase subunit gamma|nr:F0F1 ATP synthase subunit gamma [Bacteroidota bacterium]